MSLSGPTLPPASTSGAENAPAGRFTVVLIWAVMILSDSAGLVVGTVRSADVGLCGAIRSFLRSFNDEMPKSEIFHQPTGGLSFW